MLSRLKNHPFPVEAFFESSVVLTFAVPKNQVESLIPPCLSLDLLNEKYAFVAVAMVQTKGLRPKGFPKILGNDFFLIGYRVFVKYYNNVGKRLRGLYILKSETDKRKMEFFGNIFTHYNYTTTDIKQEHHKEYTIVQSKHSDFKIKLSNDSDGITLPPDSPFSNWQEARRFAGPLPFTFTYNPKTKEVLIIEGVRQHWEPKPVKIINYNFSFLDTSSFKDAVLANAFVINNVPYFWKKGKIEKWLQ